MGGGEKRNSFYREILRIKRFRKAKRKMDYFHNCFFFLLEAKVSLLLMIVNDMMIVFFSLVHSEIDVKFNLIFKLIIFTFREFNFDMNDILKLIIDWMNEIFVVFDYKLSSWKDTFCVDWKFIKLYCFFFWENQNILFQKMFVLNLYF